MKFQNTRRNAAAHSPGRPAETGWLRKIAHSSAPLHCVEMNNEL
jgi:hypothetical protein